MRRGQRIPLGNAHGTLWALSVKEPDGCRKEKKKKPHTTEKRKTELLTSHKSMS